MFIVKQLIIKGLNCHGHLVGITLWIPSHPITMAISPSRVARDPFVAQFSELLAAFKPVIYKQFDASGNLEVATLSPIKKEDLALNAGR